MDCFKSYNHIWQREKEETIRTFIMNNPLLSEFESQILYFQNLEKKINAEPEYICVGSIALYTGWPHFFWIVVFNSSELLSPFT